TGSSRSTGTRPLSRRPRRLADRQTPARALIERAPAPPRPKRRASPYSALALAPPQHDQSARDRDDRNEVEPALDRALDRRAFERRKQWSGEHDRVAIRGNRIDREADARDHRAERRVAQAGRDEDRGTSRQATDRIELKGRRFAT